MVQLGGDYQKSRGGLKKGLHDGPDEGQRKGPPDEQNDGPDDGPLKNVVLIEK